MDDVKAAAASAAALRAGLGNGTLRGDAAELAARILRAADDALARLEAEGWSSLLGLQNGESGPERLGGSAVVKRAAGPAGAGLVLDSLS